jgi:tellurite resistance protein TerC
MLIDWTAFAVFNLVLAAVLALDLGVLHRRPRTPGVGESLAWSGVWCLASLGFAALIWLAPGMLLHPGQVAVAVQAGELPAGAGMAELGGLRAEQFLAGWLIEKSLSVDNLFTIALILGAFAVPEPLRHRVLFLGIVGALIMRGVMIFAGVALIERFAWLIPLFGVMLLVVGIRMALPRCQPPDPRNHWLVRLVRRLIPVTDGYRGEAFLVVENGVRMATPLLLVLILVEFSDLIFAVDSIPAIMAVTTDPFVVYTANALALLGLRSLFFALDALMRVCTLLHYALAAILVFIGIKMILHLWGVKVPIDLSLAVIGGLVAIAVAASLLIRPGARTRPDAAS